MIGARDLELVEKNGTFNNDLELVTTVADYGGKTFPGDRATLTLALKPDSVPRLRAGGFRILNEIDLPPGRYQLRTAAREGNTKRAGSVIFDVDVPDFTKEKLSISGIALTSATSSVVPTARPKDPLAKMLPGPMTTYRDFVAGDELALFVEIYDNSSKAAHKVEIEASLKSEGGQSVFTTREERDSSELAGGPGGYGFTARVPLKGVAPGLYVLRVQGTSRIGDQLQVVARDHRARRARAGAMTHAAPPPGAARGLDPRAAAVLAYSAWWVTGALFLLVERHDARVRFHAAQSVVVFGAVSAAIAVAYGTALPLMLVSAPAARVALWLPTSSGWPARRCGPGWSTRGARRAVGRARPQRRRGAPRRPRGLTPPYTRRPASPMAPRAAKLVRRTAYFLVGGVAATAPSIFGTMVVLIVPLACENWYWLVSICGLRGVRSVMVTASPPFSGRGCR